jgi:hypothetical protein
MKTHKLIFLFVALAFISIIFPIYTNVSGINPTKKASSGFPLNNLTIADDALLENTLKTNSFEGKIELIEKKQFDTITYILTIKKNFIRLDELKQNKKIDKSLLFNLVNNTIFALQHDKKMYIDLPVHVFQSSQSNKVKVLKTTNSKLISGLKCFQWRVKNIPDNTEITYWVSGNQFGFYDKFLKLWNKTDKCYQYFLSIPEINGTIPVQQVERTLLRDIRATITINKITPQAVDTNLLTIPRNYKLFIN